MLPDAGSPTKEKCNRAQKNPKKNITSETKNNINPILKERSTTWV
jgi:hypothetical protein